MNTASYARLVAIIGLTLAWPVMCSAAWNIDKARDVGLDALSERPFANDFEKARYIMGRLGEALAANNVAPNGTLTGRVGSVLMSGTANQGTCQWCAETLKEALKSAGVSPKNMFVVYGNARALSGSDININRSHAALAVVVNGKVLVFDLWKHGMEKKTFRGASNSIWNGRLLTSWAVGLKNYEYFGFEGDSVDSKKTAQVGPFERELLQAWKLMNKPRKVAPPPPKTGTKRLRSGSYRVEAGGALLVWDIVVTSSGAITGTCNGTEELTGSISGDVIRVKRACPGFEPPYQEYTGTYIGGKFVGMFKGAGVESPQGVDWFMRYP